MKKIVIGVWVPAIGRKHDFIVPNTLGIAKIIDLMCMTLKDEYGVCFKPQQVMLMNQEDQTVLNRDCSMKQLGVQNGSQFILM